MNGREAAGCLAVVGMMLGCGPSTAANSADTDGSSSGSDDERSTGAPSDDETSAGSASASASASASGGDEAGGSTAGTTMGAETTGAATTGGQTDACNQAHAEPGCRDPEVELCVCEQLPNCCVFEWDETCAALAEEECGATGEGTGSTGETTGTTGEPGGACEEVVTFEMLPSEATLSGAWELDTSMLGEGEIAVLNQMLGVGGSILFEPDIPCDDTWTIWVRYWEQGSDDSYNATLDGMPMPEAIFEGDCSGGGEGYAWAALNWRDPADPPCVYVEDPWTPTWEAGTHAIEFSYRESLAMGRILITNDPALVP